MPLPIYKEVEYIVQTTTTRTSAAEAESRALKAIAEESPGYETVSTKVTASAEYPELGPVGEGYQWLVTALIKKSS